RSERCLGPGAPTNLAVDRMRSGQAGEEIAMVVRVLVTGRPDGTRQDALPRDHHLAWARGWHTWISSQGPCAHQTTITRPSRDQGMATIPTTDSWASTPASTPDAKRPPS